MTIEIKESVGFTRHTEIEMVERLVFPDGSRTSCTKQYIIDAAGAMVGHTIKIAYMVSLSDSQYGVHWMVDPIWRCGPMFRSFDKDRKPTLASMANGHHVGDSPGLALFDTADEAMDHMVKMGHRKLEWILAQATTEANGNE